MATTVALAAICEALRTLLEHGYAEEREAGSPLQNLDVDFATFNAANFAAAAIQARVSIYLYRVVPSLTHRMPAGRILADGRRQRTQLPLDLELIVSVWGADAPTQNHLLGWTMRQLEDYPTLPAVLLNRQFAGTFGPNEEVQLALNELPLEDLLDLWERLTNGEKPYQPSIPYIVRAVNVESKRTQPVGALVQSRDFDLRDLEQ